MCTKQTHVQYAQIEGERDDDDDEDGGGAVQTVSHF